MSRERTIQGLTSGEVAKSIHDLTGVSLDGWACLALLSLTSACADGEVLLNFGKALLTVSWGADGLMRFSAT